MLPKKDHGFTLIEIMVAISIVAVISTIGMVVYTSAQVGARDAKRKQDFRALQTALEIYYQANKNYPTKNVSSDDATNWNQLFASGIGPTTNYINNMPKDPLNRQRGSEWFVYRYISNDGLSYILCTDLENNSDPERQDAICQTYPGTNADYRVTPP